MSKKCYRYYGGLLGLQQKWLNKMSKKGYRLVRTIKAMYEFEPCAPGQYQYCVEFVGEKSKQGADDYVRFLEDCGYRVFYKNINLNYAVGKVRVRPWANQGGKIATNATTYNRELLIVEKVSDGKPFELHTRTNKGTAKTEENRGCFCSFGLPQPALYSGKRCGGCLLPSLWLL